MQIVYFYQYFGTPKGGWSTRVYEMCRRWVDEGHSVTVVTTPYDKSDVDKFRGLTRKFNYDGIEVIVLNFPQSNKDKIVKRIVRFIQYISFAIYFVFKLKYDVAIASSGPITVGILGILAKKIRRKKFVFEVRDLWPAGSVQLGVLTNPFLKRFSFWFEAKCYKTADLIVACSEGMKKDIELRFNYKHIIVVPNASDTKLFNAPDIMPVPDDFRHMKLIVYTGSLGVMDHCMQIMEAARLLDIKRYPDTVFIIIGDGIERIMMEQYKEQHQLDHVHFMGLIAKTEVVPWLSNAYCAIVCFKGVPILDTVSPNKMFDAFAAGVPIVQTTQGWIKDLLDEKKCGINVPPDNPEEMITAIHAYLDDEGMRNIHARNALGLAESIFSRDFCAKKMLLGLEALFDNKAGKNVWIINQFAGHASSGWGERHFFMARYWREAGYRVTIVSGSFNHMFLKLPNAPRKFNFEYNEETHFCWVKTPTYNPKSVLRFWSMLVFAWRVYGVPVKKAWKPDYIVVSSMPIFPVLTGYLLKKKYSAVKLIFEIRDIWPLTLIQLGETSAYHPIAQFIGWFEKFGYKNSDAIVTLLPYAIKHIVENGGAADKVAYIPNGLDEKALNQMPLDESIKKQIPVSKFIIGYTGTHSLANALEYLVEAAALLKNDPDVFFVFVGDGYKRGDLILQAEGLQNILFIPKIPKQQIHQLLSLFNICFVGRQSSTLFDHGISGNKYFDYMMASKPILDSNNSVGGPAELAGCCIKVPAESAEAIVEGIKQFRSLLPEEIAAMGKRGNVYLHTNHRISILANKYMQLFKP